MGTTRSVACNPTFRVDRGLDAANVCDKKTWMERLELAEHGLSTLRAQPWLTVADRVVKSFCCMFVASAHPAQAGSSEWAC